MNLPLSFGIETTLFNRLMTSCQLIIPRFTPAGWFECDLAAITNAGFLREYEIKTSRADFKKDLKKADSGRFDWKTGQRAGIQKKHERLMKGDVLGPSQFWFITSEELVEKDEVPEHAGLYFARLVDQRPWRASFIASLTEIKKAPRLHQHRVLPRVVKQAHEAGYWRFWNLYRENWSKLCAGIKRPD